MVPLVVILAGGKGKRFEPLVTNKTLFPFLGKTIIEHNLETVARAGFTRTLVATNKDNDKFVKKLKIKGLDIETSRQTKPLGMADALISLKRLIGGQPIMVMNAVDVVEAELFTQMKLRFGSSYSLVAGMKVTEYFPGGYMQVDGNRVVSIVEKPDPGNIPSDLVNLVFHYYKSPTDFFRILERINSERDDVYELALDELMKSKIVNYFSYGGAWAKLKYPHFVLNVAGFFNKRLVGYVHPEAQVSSKCVVEKDVYIDAGAKIHEYAVIKGRSYIGRDVVVGNHSLILDSMIEQGSVVGAGSEVSRSYLGPNCWLHHNFVGDSVLEKDVNPSYGTCFANMRLDKKPVRITLENEVVDTGSQKFGSIVASGMFSGVNCSFMPGTVVGSGVVVFPSKLVSGYVAPGAVVN